VIEGKPIAERHDGRSRRSVWKLLHRKAIGTLRRSQPGIEVAAQDARNVCWKLGEERAHLTRARAVTRQPATPPARAVLQVYVRDQQPLPVHLGGGGNGHPALALAGQLDRADIDQRPGGEDGDAAFGAGAGARRREEGREPEPPPQVEDVGVRLLQQQDEVGNRPPTRQAGASDIVDELREVTPAGMQVPRDEDENGPGRENEGRDADTGARASEGQRGDQNDQTATRCQAVEAELRC